MDDHTLDLFSGMPAEKKEDAAGMVTVAVGETAPEVLTAPEPATQEPAGVSEPTAPDPVSDPVSDPVAVSAPAMPSAAFDSMTDAGREEDGSGGRLPPMAPLSPDGDDYHPLGQYAEHAYLAYAMSVVKGRAIPDVRDGLKHVQRRILYGMHLLNVISTAKPVKSARVVGEVLGKFHPHSDQAAYDAMVRLAQDFSMRYPLIHGEGNFGSRDGDNAAAMRYTEAKLSPLAELLLGEIDQGTVDFVPNYDGTLAEPALLPARLPMILLNGQTGIGVGMATETPSHNLREVAAAAIDMIRRPNATLADLMQHIQGPDFPGGGHIISSRDDLLAAYASGRGALRMRARWTVDQLARGQWRIVIHELPHGVSASQIVAEIGALTEPQPKKGDKDVSAAQKHLKQLFLNLLDTVRDESDKDHPVRLVLEPKSSRQKPDEFMQAFLTHTSLETNYAMNLVVIGLDGRPTQKNLRDILSEWVVFRTETVTRRTRHRLGKVEDRIHILEGRQIVLLNIDEVIRIIRESDEPKTALIQAFNLTERQAEDILEIRLRQLARLEAIKIEQELSDLRKERDALNELLADPAAMRRQIVKEIRADADKYGDDRRTLIEAAAAASFTQNVANEPVTIILSEKGWIRSRAGHGVDETTLTFKEGDRLLAVIETRTVEPVVLIDDAGRAYTLAASGVPGGRGEGVPLNTLLDLPPGARICHALSARPQASFLFSVSAGYGFIARMEDLISRLRAGKAFMSVEAGERINRPVPVEDGEGQWLAALSSDERLLVFPLDEVRRMARGRGLQLMALGDATLADLAVVKDRVVVGGIGRGGKPQELSLSGEELAPFISRRGRRGRPVSKTLKSLRLLPQAAESEPSAAV